MVDQIAGRSAVFARDEKADEIAGAADGKAFGG
jgi:hypothetical protein